MVVKIVIIAYVALPACDWNALVQTGSLLEKIEQPNSVKVRKIA
jgi:hypothetical protein